MCGTIHVASYRASLAKLMVDCLFAENGSQCRRILSSQDANKLHRQAFISNSASVLNDLKPGGDASGRCWSVTLLRNRAHQTSPLPSSSLSSRETIQNCIQGDCIGNFNQTSRRLELFSSSATCACSRTDSAQEKMCSQAYTLYTCGCKMESEFKQCEEKLGTDLMCHKLEDKLQHRPRWCFDCCIPEDEVKNGQNGADPNEKAQQSAQNP